MELVNAGFNALTGTGADSEKIIESSAHFFNHARYFSLPPLYGDGHVGECISVL